MPCPSPPPPNTHTELPQPTRRRDGHQQQGEQACGDDAKGLLERQRGGALRHHLPSLRVLRRADPDDEGQGTHRYTHIYMGSLVNVALNSTQHKHV